MARKFEHVPKRVLDQILQSVKRLEDSVGPLADAEFGVLSIVSIQREMSRQRGAPETYEVVLEIQDEMAVAKINQLIATDPVTVGKDAL